MDDLRRKFNMWMLRNNRKLRFRIYRKLQGMLAMNEALSRALERLWYNSSDMGRHPERPSAMALQEWLKRDRAGETLSEAMNDWIPSAELYMIRAGEESGQVSNAMLAIMHVGDSAQRMRSAIIQAVSYPLFMMVLLAGVFWLFGVNLIENMRKAAPKKVLDAMSGIADVSDFVMQNGIIMVIIIVGTIFFIAGSMPYWKGKLRVKFDKYPPWAWYRVWQGSSFLLGLSALLKAQVPLKRAVEILEEEATPWLRERLHSAREEILRGRNMGEALRAGGFDFPDPQVALDLEILSERSDVGAVIDVVTKEWIEEQIEVLTIQAGLVRTGGLVCVGGVIAWAMMSILRITTILSDMQNSGSTAF
ncbi:MAG: type II secretion system F family protein [Alphaproteobacteria bacterium]|nr:type II secretion system F family protein [Alphaproteobacteria bacterium]